jgi:hypothetical protein
VRASAKTRVFREDENVNVVDFDAHPGGAMVAQYRELDAYEQSVVALDTNGIGMTGMRMALSPCRSILVTTCANHTESVLFVWSATSPAVASRTEDDDPVPLAIFIQREPVSAFAWFEDAHSQIGVRLIFLCKGERAVYSWIPGDVAPRKEVVDFIPKQIVGRIPDSKRFALGFIAAAESGRVTFERRLFS